MKTKLISGNIIEHPSTSHFKIGSRRRGMLLLIFVLLCCVVGFLSSCFAPFPRPMQARHGGTYEQRGNSGQDNHEEHHDNGRHNGHRK